MKKENILHEIISVVSGKHRDSAWEKIGQRLKNLFLEFSSETDENIHCLKFLEYGTSSPSKRDGLPTVGFKIKDKDIFISDIMNAIEDLDAPPAPVKAYFPELTQAEWEAATRMMTVLLLLLEKEFKLKTESISG